MSDKYIKLSETSPGGTGDGSSSINYYSGGATPAESKANWRTAVAALSPGDTLYLMEPTGGGDIIIDYTLWVSGVSGTAGNPITIKPYGTDTIEISGGDNRDWPPFPGVEDYESGIYIALLSIEDSNYLTIENITIKNSGSEGLKVYPDTGDSNHLTIKDVTATNCLEKGMRFTAANNLTIDGCTISYNDCDSNRIYENRTDHGAGLGLQYCDDAVIKNTIVHDNAGEGILIDYKPKEGDYSTGLTMDNCVVYNNMVINLYIHGMAGPENKVIKNCQFYNTPDAYYKEYFGGVWRRSLIELNTTESQYNWVGSLKNLDFYNNIVAFGEYGITFSTSDYTGVHSDMVLEHNTFIYNDVNLFIRSRAFANPTSNVLRNNVFIAGTGQAQTAGVFTADAFDTADYNCWYEEGSGTGPSTHVQGANDLNENPDLVDHTAAVLTRGSLDPANYIPVDGVSPVIGAGADTLWTTDYYGSSRTSGLFTMGFAEATYVPPPAMGDRYIKLSESIPGGTGDGTTPTDYLAGGKANFKSAVAMLSPGDTLYLMEPTGGGDIIVDYTLEVHGISGTSGNPITIKPYGTDTIEISGGNTREWPPFPGIENYTSGIYTALFEIKGCNYVTVEGLIVKNSGSEGLKMYTDSGDNDNIIIKDVVVTNCRERALRVLNATNLEIDGCTISYNDCSSSNIYPNRGGHSNALSLRYVDGAVVKDCVVHDNAGGGIIIDPSATDVTHSTDIHIHDCVVYNNAEYNILVQCMAGSENKVVNNCLFYYSPDSYYKSYFGDEWRGDNVVLDTTALFLGWVGALHNIDFYNNIVSYGEIGISLATSDVTGTHQDNIIEQNTVFYNNINLNIESALASPSGNSLKNNVFIAGTGQAQTAGVFTADAFDTADYNCWYEEGSGTGPSSYVQGPNDLNENPILINLGALVLTRGSLNPDNYRPDASQSSPLINSGVNTPWTKDFYDFSRLSDEFDIGFAEGSVGELIQSKDGFVDANLPQGYITLSFDFDPQPGSLLVAAHYSGDGTITQPVGWSVAFWLTQPIANNEGGLYYKIAGLNEPREVTVESALPNEHVMVIAEFSGPYADPPFDVEDHDLYSEGDEPRVLDTVALAQIHNLVIGVAAGRRQVIVEPVQSGGGFSSGFTEVSISGSNYKWVDLDFKRIASSDPQHATWDANAAYDVGHHAGIAVFKALLSEWLMADGLGVGSMLGTPTLGQVHNLEGMGLESQVEIDIPELGQEHQLIPDGLFIRPSLRSPTLPAPGGGLSVKVQSKLGKPSISQTHILTASGVKSTVVLDLPTPGQVYVLSADGLTSLPSLDSPILTHIHALGAIPLVGSSELGRPVLEVIPIGMIAVVFTTYALRMSVWVLSSNSSTRTERLE